MIIAFVPVWVLQVKEGAEPGLLPLALNASVLLSWPGSGSGQSGWSLFGRHLSYAFGGILMLDEEQEGLGLSPLKSGPQRLGNHMFLNRGLVNKFGYILPYYEDHLCVLLWRNPKDMRGKQGSMTVYIQLLSFV